MSEIRETSQWLKFFIDAGIPAGDATDHAITFSDNRIKQDMLSDLNKEYLKDMGINALGDIIAILKHAKSVNELLSRQRAFPYDPHATVKRSVSPQATNTTVKEVSSSKPKSSNPHDTVKKNSAATRMLEHYIRKESPSSSTVGLLNVSPVVPQNLCSRLGGSKKRSLDDSDAAVSKTNKRSSVFNRLGDNLVTSTTNEAPKITVTMLGKEKLRSVAQIKPSSSTGTYKPLKAMRMDEEESAAMTKIKSLQYHGVLKCSYDLDDETAIAMPIYQGQNIKKASSHLHKPMSLIEHKADQFKGVRGRLGAMNKRTSQSEGIFAKDYGDIFLNEKSYATSSKKVSDVEGSSKTVDHGSSYKSLKSDSMNQLRSSGKKVIKKIVRINKKTGQIVSSKSVPMARSTVFSRLDK